MVYSLWVVNVGKPIFRLNTVILIKLKVKSITDVFLPTIASNKLRCDAIRLGAVCVFDVTHGEIMETVFSR